MIGSILATAVLVINEIMASNVGTVMSPATNFDSWIELYNPTDEDISLNGFFLSDDSNNLKQWQMPADIGFVPAKGFKVIWLGSNNIKHNQAPFNLDCEGGTICLSDKNGELIVSESYPEAMSRVSYARKTDGTGEWGLTANATPGTTNTKAVFATNRLDPPVVSQDSKLFTSSISVNVNIPEGTTLVYTTDGSVPDLPSGQIQSPQWTNHIVNGNCENDNATCLIGKDGNAGGAFQTNFRDGAGYNGTRGIVVHSVSSPAEDWDTQFFVYTPDFVWLPGAKYRFKMMVRADKPAHISVQSHTQPSNYIHWSMLDGGYNITREWQEISFEGTVSNEQAGTSGLQTIAFNLNELRGNENNYYFDDISWESYDVPETATGQISTNGIFSFNNTTNLCVRLYKDGWLPSIPVTRSYIKTDNKYTIPVVSIVGNKKYFTDNQWGIDTKGTNGKTGNGQSSKCNWNMDWERPVNFSFITTEGTMAYNQDVQISVSGGWTRSATPRSFKLKAGKEFDGKNRLDYTFFPQKPYLRNKVLLLRNGGNDVWENNGSRFLDPALQTIIQRSGINLDVQSYVPIIEYVNGEFRGVLNMREPNNKKYVEANFGYDDEKIDMFEMSADSNVVFMVGTPEILNRIYKLGEQAEKADVYEELQQLLDMDEYINYMAVELFLGSNDWPHNNIKGYRDQQDGRYRFVTFDLDFAFKNSNPFTAFANDQWHTFNYIYDTQEERYEEIKLVTLFLNLLKNDTFRKKFIDTFCLIGGSVFEKERATAIVDELADFVRPMMQLDGWRSPDGSANLIRSKLQTLNDDMITCMQNFRQMQLANVKKQKVQLKTDTREAKLFVNDLEIPYSEFDGTLFAPVVLKAQAPAGYSFVGWKQTTTASNEIIGKNSIWKYYDKGALSNNNWRAASYNDNTWASGESPLGYKMDGIKTTVSYGTNASQKNPTTYFRYTFNLKETPASKDVFILNYEVDDGFIIYVNGVEAGRFNMPNGTVTFNTYSSSYASDTPLTGTIDLPARLFRSGSNVVAVEVHNNSASSSDLYWAAQLVTSVDAEDKGMVSTESTLELPDDYNIALTACFQPLSEEEKAAQGITPVRINEVSAANGIYVNEYWKRNDWIELYNTTDEPIDVEGMFITDNPKKPEKYQISKGSGNLQTVIQPHDFLIIWCDNLEPVSQLHASFKLAADGGSVILSAQDHSWTDELAYNEHAMDETVGRYPDGSNDVYLMNIPSIAKTNVLTSYLTPVEQANPNGIQHLTAQSKGDLTARYVMGSIIVRSNDSKSVHVNIYNLAGQFIGSKDADLNGNYAEIPVGELSKGCYIAQVRDNNGHSATCKFVK